MAFLANICFCYVSQTLPTPHKTIYTFFIFSFFCLLPPRDFLLSFSLSFFLPSCPLFSFSFSLIHSLLFFFFFFAILSFLPFFVAVKPHHLHQSPPWNPHARVKINCLSQKQPGNHLIFGLKTLARDLYLFFYFWPSREPPWKSLAPPCKVRIGLPAPPKTSLDIARDWNRVVWLENNHPAFHFPFLSSISKNLNL